MEKVKMRKTQCFVPSVYETHEKIEREREKEKRRESIE
jgi:hypothetical protein